MSITISEKAIKNKVKIRDRVIVVENIKYPQFESEKYRKLCKKMNEFYCSVAKKYAYVSEKKLSRQIGNNPHRENLPFAIGMKYTVALCNEKIISVVLDLTFTQGEKFKTRRFTQMWSIKKQDIFRTGEIIKTDRTGRKKIFSLIVEAAKKNESNPAFEYFGDYLKRLARSFDITNCFAVPKGLCFFVNAGILSPMKCGANTFVLTSSELKEVLLGDFLTCENEKKQKEMNIVNNI